MPMNAGGSTRLAVLSPSIWHANECRRQHKTGCEYNMACNKDIPTVIGKSQPQSYPWSDFLRIPTLAKGMSKMTACQMMQFIFYELTNA